MKKKSSHNTYMRSKLKMNRSRRIHNIGVFIHWAGFVSLTFSVVLLPMAGLREFMNYSYTTNSFLDFMFDFENLGYLNSGDEPAFWVVWLAVTHWPLKFILTGEKNFLPWRG